MVCSVFWTGMIYAYINDSVTVTNKLSLGDVNIQLEEYEIKNGKEIKYINQKMVLPGETISKIPRIYNNGEDCWVRTKIDYSETINNSENFSDKNLIDIQNGWKKIGEYYYYTKILKKGTSVDFFKGIVIPETWGNDRAGNKLKIELRTDAIQAANFTPVFNNMSPWGNQEIQQCIHSTDGSITCKKDKLKLSVELSEKAQRLIAVPDDFFYNLPVAMPGDLLTDSVLLSNTSGKTAELLFATNISDISKEQEELIEKLGCTIYFNDLKLYEGNLKAANLKEGISLGKFKNGEKGTLSFEIAIPKEIKNEDALRSVDVKWIFSAKEDLSQQESYMNNPTLSEQNNSSSSYVKTGDNSQIYLYCAILICAVFMILLSVIFLNRRNK